MEKHKIQNETIQKLCVNRKLQNIEFLKEWDLQRAKKLMIHRKIIDQFDESIQDKIVESNAYIDVLRQFLTDLLTQKIKHELQVVNNPETRIKNNLAGKIVHHQSGRQLGKLYQLTNNYKGYKKLKAILEIGLEKIENLLVESQKAIMEMRTSIELKVVEIQNCNDLTLELCQSLISVFNKDKHSKPFLSENDLYQEEQQFIYQAFIQTETERQFGQLIIVYLEYVEKLEKRKLTLVKEVIGSYLEGIREENQNEEQLNSLKDILKKQTENKYIDECYSAEQLLSKTTLTQLCRIEGKHEKEITIKFMKNFLKKLQFIYFEHINYLVLKQYRIFIKFDEDLQEINALITVDAFLNIYFNKKELEINDNSQENIYQNIDFCLKIDSSLGINKQGDINLVLETKKMTKSEQFRKMSHIQLIFANEDQRQEFVQFIDKIIR